MTASFVRSHCLNLKLLSFPLSTSLPRTPGPSPRKALLLRHLSILQGFMGPSPSTPKRHPGAICVDPKKASWGHLLWPQKGLLGPSASAPKWYPGAICFGPKRASLINFPKTGAPLTPFLNIPKTLLYIPTTFPYLHSPPLRGLVNMANSQPGRPPGAI